MANENPSAPTVKLAKELSKGSLDPKHGLTVPAKIISKMKPRN